MDMWAEGQKEGNVCSRSRIRRQFWVFLTTKQSSVHPSLAFFAASVDTNSSRSKETPPGYVFIHFSSL